jgi:hypothetical protein
MDHEREKSVMTAIVIVFLLLSPVISLAVVLLFACVAWPWSS